jgi:DNA polymerase-4
VTVKIKYANFRQITRRRSCDEAITSRATVEQLTLDLLQPQFPPSRGVRLRRHLPLSREHCRQ